MNTDGNERPSPQSWYPESSPGTQPAAEEPAGTPQAVARPSGATPPSPVMPPPAGGGGPAVPPQGTPPPWGQQPPMQGPPMQGPPMQGQPPQGPPMQGQPPQGPPMQGPPMQGRPPQGPPMQPQFMPPHPQGPGMPGGPVPGQHMQPQYVPQQPQVRVVRANRRTGPLPKPLIAVLVVFIALPILASLGSVGWYYTRSAGTFGPPLDACSMLTLDQVKTIAPSAQAPTEKEPVLPDGTEEWCYWRGLNDSSIEGQVYSVKVQVEMFGRSFTKGGDENAKADFADDKKAYKTAPLSGLGDETFQILPDKYGHNGLAFRRGNLIVNIEISLALLSRNGGDQADAVSRQGLQAAMAAGRLILQNLDSGKVGRKN